MRTLITGATGLIGRAIAPHFSSVVALSRDPERARDLLGDVDAYPWDPVTSPPPAGALEGVEAVINLVGESVGEGRWTRAKKRRLWDTRVVATMNLVKGIERAAIKPKVLVSSSALGFYGSRGDEILDESANAGTGFLADLSMAWEREAKVAEKFGVRVVLARTSLVLAKQAPALQKLARIFRLGIGGPLGNGKQWMSWVHLDDAVGLILHVVKRENIRGPLNVASPQPVRNRDFTKQVARALGRPAFLPAPAFGLRIVLGEFADSLLSSQRLAPSVAENTGYAFRYPELGRALEASL